MDETQLAQLKAPAEAVVKSYSANRKAMLKQREAIARELAKTRALLAGNLAPGARRSLEVTAEIHEIMQRIYGKMQLDSPDTIHEPNAGAAKALEFSLLKLQLLRLEVAVIDLGCLEARIRRDLMPATGRKTGKLGSGRLNTGRLAAAAPGAPWQQREDAEWQGACKVLLEAYPLLRETVGAAVRDFAKLEAGPIGPDALTAAQALGIPALAGEHYRLYTAISRLPGGQAALDANRAIATIDPEQVKAAEAAETSEKKSFTDRLRGLFQRTEPG